MQFLNNNLSKWIYKNITAIKLKKIGITGGTGLLGNLLIKELKKKKLAFPFLKKIF